MKVFIVLSAIFSIAAVLHAKPQSGGHDGGGAQTDAMAGIRMSADDAKGLEDEVAKKPDDLSARAKLLGYYFTSKFTVADAKEASRKHVLWVIKNHPESEIASTPYCKIEPGLDPDGYHDAKQLWLEQLKSHAKDATVVGNAARFFSLHDRELAEKLLKQAAELEPNNPQWPDLLGHQYALQHSKESAANSLAEFEKAQAADTTDESKGSRLVELAKSAYAAGELEKAGQFAEDLLKTGAKDPKNWNYGNSVHQGNNVLGQIALKQGHIQEADEFLLKAGATPGSPQLDSFGPNMSLAEELLKAGEKETVLQYFESCRKFWRMGGERLDRWTKEVKAGLAPEFGANLVY